MILIFYKQVIRTNFCTAPLTFRKVHKMGSGLLHLWLSLSTLWLLLRYFLDNLLLTFIGREVFDLPLFLIYSPPPSISITQWLRSFSYSRDTIQPEVMTRGEDYCVIRYNDSTDILMELSTFFCICIFPCKGIVYFLWPKLNSQCTQMCLQKLCGWGICACRFHCLNWAGQ